MRKVMWWSTTPLTISEPSKSTFRTTRSLTRLARLECRRMLDWTTSSGSWLSTERAAEWTQWEGSVQFHHASQNLWEVSQSSRLIWSNIPSFCPKLKSQLTCPHYLWVTQCQLLSHHSFLIHELSSTLPTPSADYLSIKATTPNSLSTSSSPRILSNPCCVHGTQAYSTDPSTSSYTQCPTLQEPGVTL